MAAGERVFSIPCISTIYGGQSPGHRWYRPVVEATSPTPRLTPVIYLIDPALPGIRKLPQPPARRAELL